MNRQKLSIIGMPMDLGQMRRGVDMGPSAIRYAGVNERLKCLFEEIHDQGDIAIGRPEVQIDPNSNLRNLHLIAEKTEMLAEKVDHAIKGGSFPLVLGGDHSIAIGTLAGVSKHYSNLGVIWYDAHGDLNTAETSPSGNIHGMPLAVSLGMGHPLLTNVGDMVQRSSRRILSLLGQGHWMKENGSLLRKKALKCIPCMKLTVLE